MNGNPVLSWTASTDNVGVAGYRIHRSTNGTFGAQIRETTSTTRTWTDTSVTEAVAYTYAVVAFDAAGYVSNRSALRSVTAGAVPTTPTALTASIVNGKIQLAWNASTDNVGVVEYIVYRATSATYLGPRCARDVDA